MPTGCYSWLGGCSRANLAATVARAVREAIFIGLHVMSNSVRSMVISACNVTARPAGRADFTRADLSLVLTGAAAVMHAAGVDAPSAWRRFLILSMEGFQPSPTPASDPRR